MLNICRIRKCHVAHDLLFTLKGNDKDAKGATPTQHSDHISNFWTLALNLNTYMNYECETGFYFDLLILKYFIFVRINSIYNLVVGIKYLGGFVGTKFSFYMMFKLVITLST